jgi:hypothetical protein
MPLPLTNSFVSKILPLTFFSGKIWREFPAIVVIRQDRRGGGYIALTSRAERDKCSADSRRKSYSAHFERHQISAFRAHSLVIDRDLTV